jgi:hypothetical protein
MTDTRIYAVAFEDGDKFNGHSLAYFEDLKDARDFRAEHRAHGRHAVLSIVSRAIVARLPDVLINKRKSAAKPAAACAKHVGPILRPCERCGEPWLSHSWDV